MRRLRVLIAGLCGVALALPGSALAAPGDLYVADESASGGNGAIFKLAPGGGATASILATDATLFEEPWGLVMAPDRSLLVADYSTDKIYRVSRTGAISEFFSDPSQPALTDLAWGPDGNLYVLDYIKKNIIRLNPKTGAFQQVADNTGVPDWQSGNSIVVARDLTIYFTSANSDEVFEVSPSGTVSKLYEGPLLTDALGLFLSPDERWVYATENGTGKLIRIDRRTGAATPFATFPAGSGATGIAQLRDGSFLVGDHNNNGRINRAAPSGSPVTIFSDDPDWVYPVDTVVEPPLCGGKLPTVVGTDRRDVIRGSRFADVILVLGGKDVVRGLAGKDIVCGGKGRDKLIGGKGRDRLLGGPGRDVLRGGPGRDIQRQ